MLRQAQQDRGGVFTLLSHPDTPCASVASLTCELETDPLYLCATFSLTGDVSRIVLPELTDAARTDGLWRTTCFEMFVGIVGSTEYLEFNWSPSMKWAAYRFESERQGMQPFGFEEPLTAAGSDERSHYWLSAGLKLEELPRGPWQLGLSAVIELLDGSKSYWALAHAPGPPDFHNRDCFTATLAAPDAP